MKLQKDPGKIIPGCIFILAGIFSYFSVVAPSRTGILGQNYYIDLLNPVFGHAALLFSIFLALAGLIFIFSDKVLLRLPGLVLLFFPILIRVDELYITEVFSAQSLLNRMTKAFLVVYIGNIGFMLIEVICVITGLLMLFFRSGVAIPRFIRWRPFSGTSDVLKEHPENTETGIPHQPAIATDEGEEASQQSDDDERALPLEKPNRAQGISLNLKPYGKKFVKPKLTDFRKQPADSVSYGEKKDRIKEVFSSMGVEVEVGGVIGGPSVEQYEIIPGKGVKLSQIKKLDEDLSLALKSRVLITFNAQGSLCVEAPIARRRTVFFRRLLESAGETEAKLPVILGVNASYETFSFDLAELPHLLIAGTTGSGKSILVKTILASIMYNLTPNDVRLVLIDPKRVDFGLFNASPFMAHKVITSMDDAVETMRTLVSEMERRYDLLEQNNAANIALFNESLQIEERLPYIITVVDEFADLIMSEKTDIGDNIIRIAQKARACGIHLILATQRPSAEVISGLIKANVPGKIALSVSSSINSKIIIDRTGAEKLLGKGDMIFISPEEKDGIRLQGAFISDDEIMKFMK